MPPAPRVVLGVCGSIAAYKAAEVCRRLVDAGVHVIPVMTADAGRFIGEVTLSALASEPVRTSLWPGRDGSADDPVPHIALARTADVVLVAPATARLLGSYAAGIADDLLTATLLATRAPVVVCPAMHTEMWEHAATRANVAVLRRRGVHVVDPDTGKLAAGDVGAGRLPDPDRIVAEVLAVLAPGDRRRPRRAAASWSPPAAPASRSTRSASWATARRAGRARPWPWRPPGAAPTWCSSPPPPIGPTRSASTSSTWRPRRRWRRR